MRQQEFGEQANVASAADEIARFNALQRAAVQQRNVGGMNEAQLRNLAERQRIAEKSIDIQNKQQQYNKELLQQEYLNKMTQAGAKGDILTGQASDLTKQAAGAAQQGASIGKSIGDVVSAGGSYFGGKIKTPETDSEPEKKEPEVYGPAF
jgi:hypothetical protein